MSNMDRIILDAVIVETYKGGVFMAELPNKTKVTVRPSGKIQKNMIKIIVGDRVKIEVSPYDMSKGRIITRIKENWRDINE